MMTKPVAYALLTVLTTTAGTLVVQFPQYAVYLTLASTVLGGLLRSPLFAKATEKPE